MKFRLIEAYRAMIECGSVTAAAHSLKISQPAMTKLLAQLQDELDLELFERQGGRLVPTPEATALIGSVDRAWLGIAEFVEAARDVREIRRGGLKIVACPAFAHTLLPDFIAEFTRSANKTILTLHSQTSQRVIDWTADGQADVGIAAMFASRHGVNSEPLGDLNAVCALPRSHPLASRSHVHASDLDGQPFISLADVDRSRSKIDAVFHQHSVRRDLRFIAPQASIALALVANGLGLAIIDPLTATLADTEKVVIRPFLPSVKFEMHMYHPANRIPSQVQELFVRSLRSWCKARFAVIDTIATAGTGNDAHKLREEHSQLL